MAAYRALKDQLYHKETERGHLPPLSSGSQMIQARECSNQIHSFPVHTVCLEFLPVIPPMIWVNNIIFLFYKRYRLKHPAQGLQSCFFLRCCVCLQTIISQAAKRNAAWPNTPNATLEEREN